MRADSNVVNGNPAVQYLDVQIASHQKELHRLEAARNILVTAEPAPSKRGKKRGRPATRKFQASGNSSTGTKRRPGRPKGSKNKPKPGSKQDKPVSVPTPPAEEFAETTA